MTQLIVRNIEDEVVESLKLRAAQHGRSAEAEHRELLREALLGRPGPSLKAHLLAMPDLGEDADFEPTRQGVERLRLRDAAAAGKLDHWLGDLAHHHAARLLPVDARVAELWGRMNVPDPVPAIDGLLAATAIVHDLTLVTRNLRDVERCGARVLNPFSG